MHNTWNAAKLDLALVRPYGKVICFTMVLSITFAAINRSLFTGVSFAMCFVAMTTAYPFAVEERNDMARLYGILPVNKRDLVLGRYLFVVALGALALAVSLVVQPVVLRSLVVPVEGRDLLWAAVGGSILFSLYTVFQLPGYYKFGSIKGRVFLYFPVAGFLITLFLRPRLPLGSVPLSPVLLMGLGVVLVIVLYALSIWCSVRTMEHKEL